MLDVGARHSGRVPCAAPKRQGRNFGLTSENILRGSRLAEQKALVKSSPYLSLMVRRRETWCSARVMPVCSRSQLLIFCGVQWRLSHRPSLLHSHPLELQELRAGSSRASRSGCFCQRCLQVLVPLALTPHIHHGPAMSAASGLWSCRSHRFLTVISVLLCLLEK